MGLEFGKEIILMLIKRQGSEARSAAVSAEIKVSGPPVRPLGSLKLPDKAAPVASSLPKSRL